MCHRSTSDGRIPTANPGPASKNDPIGFPCSYWAAVPSGIASKYFGTITFVFGEAALISSRRVAARQEKAAEMPQMGPQNCPTAWAVMTTAAGSCATCIFPRPLDLAPRSCCTHQNDVRLLSFDLALDVVHPAKRENLMTVKTDQEGRRAPFRAHLPQC